MGLQKVRFVVAVAAGKGGVGKSTVCVNLAHALAQSGASVGILDADLYGPSIQKMLPFTSALMEKEGKIIPAISYGIHYVSLSLFAMGRDAVIVRAPIANQIIEDFVEGVEWPELDVLFIDFPPGTGDIQLTVMQKVQIDGAILVTTPQKVALLDVEKAFMMFKKMEVEVLGLVENMSYFLGQIGERYYPFGQGHVEQFQEKHGIKSIGLIPLEDKISYCSDQGLCPFDQKEMKACEAYEKIAKDLFLALMLKAKSPTKKIELFWKEMV